jgi:DNA-binding XRE family transcriptional regulator
MSGILKNNVSFLNILSILVSRGDGRMFGLGKSRTDVGRFLDKNKLTQESVRLSADISRETMADICGNANYNPHSKTMIKIVGVLRRMGYDVDITDFWQK